MKLPKRVAIVGAGISGLFMAEQLEKLASDQGRKIHITLFEKENRVGGKCYTYRDKHNASLASEYGAGAVAMNYGIVIDMMEKYGVEFEYMMPTADKGLELSELFSHLPLYERVHLAKNLLWELYEFDAAYSLYKKAKDAKTKLPENFELPFNEFAALKSWKYISSLLKPYVPGFGYGDLAHCPTYSVLEYMGHSTLISMLLNGQVLNQPGLLAIKGGFQTLAEKMSKGRRIKLGTTIQQIDRKVDSVTIRYNTGNDTHVGVFDSLVLATSPLNWPKLGMKLTKLEQTCVNKLSYYRYPVAICNIKGLPKNQYFFNEALERKGFGHVALITTRDNQEAPKNGRLATIYVNQLPGKNTYDIVESWPSIVKDLKTIPGVKGAELIDAKYWSDYLPSLPWDLRLSLDKAQGAKATNTLYLGAYTLGTFEDVISNANNAYRVAETLYGQEYTPVEALSCRDVSRASFFYSQASKPYDGKPLPKAPELSSCVIL